MTKEERQQRNHQIARMYVAFMKYHIPAHHKAIVNIADAMGLSDSTVYRVVKTFQQQCDHHMHEPFSGVSGYMVCQTCWKEGDGTRQ